VFADPTGAVLSVIEQRHHQGAQLVNERGSWTWNQLATRDLEAARTFYGQVFGWRLEQAAETPPDTPFWMWHVDGQRWPQGLAGAMVMGDETPSDTPPHWMAYFAVDDADRAVETVTRRGGAARFGPVDIPVGRLALATDAQGASFGITETHYPEPR
jgi:predicted enzyme related to lactoylglutathione lyase